MKATKARIQTRIEEVLRIRLDGAEFWDVREYAREKEQEDGSAWHLPDGAKPLSDGQLWRYIGHADKLIAESCRASRKKLLRRHLAQRRNLYAKAISRGDIRAALAVLQDEAALLNLYPAKKTQVTGKNGGPVVLNIKEEIVGREVAVVALDAIVEEVVTNDDNQPQKPGDPPPSGAAGVPEE